MTSCSTLVAAKWRLGEVAELASPFLELVSVSASDLSRIGFQRYASDSQFEHADSSLLPRHHALLNFAMYDMVWTSSNVILSPVGRFHRTFAEIMHAWERRSNQMLRCCYR